MAQRARFAPAQHQDLHKLRLRNPKEKCQFGKRNFGGAAGVVAMGVANTLPVCAQLGGACGFAASGATYAAINKRDPREGAKQGLIGGAIALPIIVATSYINASGPSGSRELTPDEVELARSVFSENADLSSVRIYNSKYILLQGQRFAMAPDGNIYWPQDKWQYG